MTWRRDPPRPEECLSWWWYRDVSGSDRIVYVVREEKQPHNARAGVVMEDPHGGIRWTNFGEWSGPLRPPE